MERHFDEAAQGDRRKFPKVQVIDGKKYSARYSADNIRSAIEMTPRPSDIFVCTNGKAGTTWLHHTVHLLLGRADCYDVIGEKPTNSIQSFSPMIELYGAAAYDQLPDPRVLKSHLCFDDMPKHHEAKYILGVRNIKDSLVSSYFHIKNFKNFEWQHGELDVFVPFYLEEHLGGMDYFEHVRSWLKAFEDAVLKILLVKYEDMAHSPVESIRRIGHFLDGDAARVVDDEEALQKIVHAASFDEMKKRQSRWVAQGLTYSETFSRRGKVGDWREHLSEEQSKLIDEKYAREMMGTSAANLCREEMQWTLH